MRDIYSCKIQLKTLMTTDDMKKKLTIRTRFLFYDFIVTISQFSFWKYFSEYTNNPLLWNLMQIQSQLPVRPIDINIKSHYTPREIYILTNTITLTSYYFPFYIANLYKSLHITDNFTDFLFCTRVNRRLHKHHLPISFLLLPLLNCGLILLAKK